MTVSDCGDNGILVSLQIVPQEMAENCFWIKVKEEKFENPDLFAQLSLCFSSQGKGKEASSLCTPSLINLHTYASFSLRDKRCQAAFILWQRFFFSRWNVNYLKTSPFPLAYGHHRCMLSIQISVPISALVVVCSCVFEKACSVMCAVFVHMDVHKLEPRAAMLGLLLAFSSPVGQSSIREALVKEALGVYLSRPVCFSDTQPGYLTCWWITQAVQSEFVFIRKRVYEGTWCIPPMTSWVFSTSLTVRMCVCVFMCVAHPSNSSSSGRGEAWALSSAEQSNRSSVSVCGHNYTESSNFSHIPTVCLDTSQPSSGFLLCLSHSLQVYKLDSSLFCTVK